MLGFIFIKLVLFYWLFYTFLRVTSLLKEIVYYSHYYYYLKLSRKGSAFCNELFFKGPFIIQTKHRNTKDLKTKPH